MCEKINVNKIKNCKLTMLYINSINTLKMTYDQMNQLINGGRNNSRIPFLIENIVYPQMKEILENQEFLDFCYEKSGIGWITSDKLDQILMWIVFMNNKDIVSEYINRFNKKFWNVKPMSDIIDLYSYLIYIHFYDKSQKVIGLEEIIFNGFDYLDNIDEENISSLKTFLNNTGGLCDKPIFLQDDK